MKELPKFMFLSHPEVEGMKIIMTEHPYLVATVYQIGKTQHDMIDSFLEDMVQGRYPMSKIPGYYIFLRMYTSLEPCNDSAYQQQILDEMAKFFLKERVEQKMGLYHKNSESDKPLLERIRERDERPKEFKLRERKRKE